MRRFLLVPAALLLIAGAGCPSFSTERGTKYHCHSQSDCDGLGGAVCDPVTQVCTWPDGGPGLDGSVGPPVQCAGNAQCPSDLGLSCVGGQCRAACDGGTCAEGEVCAKSGQCIPTDGVTCNLTCPPGFVCQAVSGGGHACERQCTSYTGCLPGWSCTGHTTAPGPKGLCVPNLCSAGGLGACDEAPGANQSTGVCVGPIHALDADGGTGLCYPEGSVPNDTSHPYACRSDVVLGDGGEACEPGDAGARPGYCTGIGADGGTVCRFLCRIDDSSPPCPGDGGVGCYPIWSLYGVCVTQRQPDGGLGGLDAGCGAPFSATTPPAQMGCGRGLLCVALDGGVDRCERACQVVSRASCLNPSGGLDLHCVDLHLPGNLTGLGYCPP